jgi:hypothetical protein
MAFVHGKSTVVLCNATNMSPYLKEVSSNQGVDMSDVTAFGTTGTKAYLPGLKDGKISASGMFDGATGAIDSVFQQAIGASSVVELSVFPDTDAIGKRGFIAECWETSYNLSSPVADVVQASAEFQASGGVDYAVSLQALSAQTVTGNGTGVDNTTSTTNGGAGMLHVTANTQNSTSIIVIQHSVDNSTFTDLVTFTTVPTITTTSEKIVVASGTTVNRYLRAKRTIAGTGSITYQTSFARK